MPFFTYAIEQIGLTTNSTTDTESNHLLLLTPTAAASKGPCYISQLKAGARGATAGGCALRLSAFATAGSGGTSVTPQPRNSRSPAANTTAANGAYTAGSGTRTDLAGVFFPATGGSDVWFPNDEDDGVVLQLGGGANGNAEIRSRANPTSVPFDFLVEFFEP